MLGLEEMAKELKDAKAKRRVRRKTENLALPKDPNDDKNIILETVAAMEMKSLFCW